MVLIVVSHFHPNNTEHRCDKKGCGHVLVIDGNMKNHRDVCLAREAGFAEFSGLPGKIKTGCPNTPQPKSRYCPSHTPTAFTPEGDTTSTETAAHTSSSKLDEQLAYITAKKITRQSTFYQVHYTIIIHYSVTCCLTPPNIRGQKHTGIAVNSNKCTLN